MVGTSAGQKDAAKDFLDTSVVIPLFFGTFAAKREYRLSLADRKYVSKYVSMEFHAACLRQLVEVYFLLDMPHIATVSDGMKYAAQHYRARQLKMDLYASVILAELASARGFRTDDPQDKDQLLEAFGDYIVRLAWLFHRCFKNTGTDSARCARAAVLLRPEFGDPGTALKEFAAAFDRKCEFRSKCDIDRFFLAGQKHRAAVENLCSKGQVYEGKSEHEGFNKIRERLQGTLDKGKGPASCAQCSYLGDAIIALDVPDDMRIAHLDHSFNALCKILGKKHIHLPSVVRATKNASGKGR